MYVLIIGLNALYNFAWFLKWHLGENYLNETWTNYKNSTNSVYMLVGPTLYVKNIKADRRDLNKQNSCWDVFAVITRLAGSSTEEWSIYKNTSLATFFISHTDLEQHTSLNHSEASGTHFMWRTAQWMRGAKFLQEAIWIWKESPRSLNIPEPSSAVKHECLVLSFQSWFWLLNNY